MTPVEINVLIDAYMHQPLSIDKLPYSPEIAIIARNFRNRAGKQIDEGAAYWELQNARRRGEVPRRWRRKS